MVIKSAKTKIVLSTTKFVLSLLLNIIFYVLVVLLIVELSTKAYNLTYQIYGNVAVEKEPGTDLEFSISEGETTMDIASRMAKYRIASNKYTFLLRAKISTSNTKPILPGKYVLNTSMNYGEILDTITDSSKSLSETNQ